MDTPTDAEVAEWLRFSDYDTGESPNPRIEDLAREVQRLREVLREQQQLQSIHGMAIGRLPQLNFAMTTVLNDAIALIPPDTRPVSAPS